MKPEPMIMHFGLMTIEWLLVAGVILADVIVVLLCDQWTRYKIRKEVK